MSTIKEEMKRNKDEKNGKLQQDAVAKEELTPRRNQFQKTTQLAFDASIMIRDFVLVDKKKEKQQ